MRLTQDSLFTRQLDSQIDDVQYKDRLMDEPHGFCQNSAISVAHSILCNQLQAISSLQDSCKDQSQAVSEAFMQKIVQPRARSHTLQRQHLAALLLLPAHAYVRDITTVIDEHGDQWEDKSTQNSTTEMSFCTFESVYDGDRGDVVRIFMGLSCEPGCLIS